MQSPTVTVPVPAEQSAPTFLNERSLLLAGGILVGGVVVGLFSFVGLARSRRNRAAADAEAIREQIRQLASVALLAAEQSLPPPPTIKPAYPDERLRNFTRGLTFGAIGGAIYGLLTAKRRGIDERARWRETILDLTSEVRNAVTDYTAWGVDDSPEPSAAGLTLGQ